MSYHSMSSPLAPFEAPLAPDVGTLSPNSTNTTVTPPNAHTAAWGSAPLGTADQLFIVEGTLLFDLSARLDVIGIY